MKIEETLSYDDILLIPSFSAMNAGDIAVETN